MQYSGPYDLMSLYLEYTSAIKYTLNTNQIKRTNKDFFCIH